MRKILASEDAAFYVFNNTSGPGTPVKGVSRISLSTED